MKMEDTIMKGKAIVLAAILLLTAGGSLTARQAPSKTAPNKAASTPRTAWGHPDLQGISDNSPHLTPRVRQWLGDSRGHWEADTLVVDTTNFTDKTNFRGSTSGFHLIERFKRV